jgi:hypothetical protein
MSLCAVFMRFLSSQTMTALASWQASTLGLHYVTPECNLDNRKQAGTATITMHQLPPRMDAQANRNDMFSGSGLGAEMN